MDKRYDAMNSITLNIPVEPMKEYINKKRKEGVAISHMALILAASALSCRLPLAGTGIEQNFDSSETAAVQAKLADLGFPEEASEKLLPEDLLSLKDTVKFGSNYSELYLYNSEGFQSEAYAFQLPDGNVRYVHFFAPVDHSGF